MSNLKDTNQASEAEPINQHLVCLWQLKDIEETIADASPEELVDLHPQLVALSTDITEAVQSAIRNEKLKLLAEVRERVVGENEKGTITDPDSPSYGEPYESTTADKEELRAELTKLEAELQRTLMTQ